MFRGRTKVLAVFFLSLKMPFLRIHTIIENFVESPSYLDESSNQDQEEVNALRL